MQPIKRMNDLLVGIASKSCRYEFEHFLLSKRQWAEVWLEDFAQKNFQFDQVFFVKLLRNCLHPFGDHLNVFPVQFWIRVENVPGSRWWKKWYRMASWKEIWRGLNNLYFHYFSVNKSKIAFFQLVLPRWELFPHSTDL